MKPKYHQQDASSTGVSIRLTQPSVESMARRLMTALEARHQTNLSYVQARNVVASVLGWQTPNAMSAALKRGGPSQALTLPERQSAPPGDARPEAPPGRSDLPTTQGPWQQWSAVIKARILARLRTRWDDEEHGRWLPLAEAALVGIDLHCYRAREAPKYICKEAALVSLSLDSLMGSHHLKEQYPDALYQQLIDYFSAIGLDPSEISPQPAVETHNYLLMTIAAVLNDSMLAVNGVVSLVSESWSSPIKWLSRLIVVVGRGREAQDALRMIPRQKMPPGAKIAHVDWHPNPESDNQPAESWIPALKRALQTRPDVVVVPDVQTAAEAAAVVEAANAGYFILTQLEARDEKDAVAQLRQLGIPLEPIGVYVWNRDELGGKWVYREVSTGRDGLTWHVRSREAAHLRKFNSMAYHARPDLLK